MNWATSGDTGFPPLRDSLIASTPLADRILAFDEESGILTAEAGITIGEIARVFLPRGFFAPVSAGTSHVTLGGAVAADIHGKNHHVSGCFGEHVLGLRMRTGAGEVLDVSPSSHPELFLATLGKLKQVCNHPAHYLGDGSDLQARSGKLTRLREMPLSRMPSE